MKVTLASMSVVVLTSVAATASPFDGKWAASQSKCANDFVWFKGNTYSGDEFGCRMNYKQISTDEYTANGNCDHGPDDRWKISLRITKKDGVLIIGDKNSKSSYLFCSKNK